MSQLDALNESRWEGTAELWLDPLGNDVKHSACSMAIDGQDVRYVWEYEGEEHAGTISLRADDAEFTDTWHQPKPMPCWRLPDAWGVFQIQGTYGPESDWGWRIALCQRTPTGELVLQMTNIAPWGEEARAVRMTCQPSV